MRPVHLVFRLSALAGAFAIFAPASTRAGDAPLFYAPGAKAAVPPIIFEGPKGATHLAPPRERICFTPAETRERIAAHKLEELFRAMQAGRLQGDALRAKLCRWKPDQFVYEIAVLRRDGHLVRVYMNARNGDTVGP